MDCSKTINFFAECNRLCNSRPDCAADADNKEQCPLFAFCDLLPSEICAETAIETVQKWSDEHPVKTYAQDFFEKFPDAQRAFDGTPFACKKRIYGGECPKDEECDYAEICEDCWNEPMEEQ